MDWNQLLGPIIAGLSIIITGLCGWVSTRVVAWLNTKIKDKQVAEWSSAVAKIIFDAVQTVFQTYVDALKKDGAFTKEAQQEALNRCLAIIRSQLTTELRDYLTANFGDIEAYLTTQIEAVIYSLKK